MSKKEESKETKIEGQDELFPPLGNLSKASMKHLYEVLSKGDDMVARNYELLVEDFIETFGGAVLQGVPPDWALFCFAQAFAVTMGQCIRAGFSPAEGGKIMAMIIKNADLSAKMVKQVTVQ